MRSIVYSGTGPSSILSLEERPLPEPGPGEVRVRLAVSGVNPTDWKNRAGGSLSGSGGEQTPNQDGAGVVDAVGAGVTTVAVGQRVWLFLAAFQQPGGTAARRRSTR